MPASAAAAGTGGGGTSRGHSTHRWVGRWVGRGRGQPAKVQTLQPLKQTEAGSRDGGKGIACCRLLTSMQLLAFHSLHPYAVINTHPTDAVPCKLFILLEGRPHTDGSSFAAYAPGQQDAQQWQPQQSMHADAATAAAAAPRGFAVKRNFRLSMRRGVHLKLLLGQRPEDLQTAAGEGHAAQPAAGEAAPCQASRGGGGSSGQRHEEAVVHLSQLPDAGPASQEAWPPAAAAAGAWGPAAVVAPALAPAPIWYLCKTAVKGLNSGCQEDGA